MKLSLYTIWRFENCTVFGGHLAFMQIARVAKSWQFHSSQISSITPVKDKETKFIVQNISRLKLKARSSVN